jgi:hypothetical protein
VPVYLVERYWPGVTIERLREALDGARRVLADMRLEGILVRPLSCTLIPGEEVVFSVYEGHRLRPCGSTTSGRASRSTGSWRQSQ